MIRYTLLRIAGDVIRLDEESLVCNLVAAKILPEESLRDAEVLEVMQEFLEGIASSGLSGETIGLLTKKLLARSDTARIDFPQELVLIGRSLLELEGLLALIGAQAPGVNYRRVALPFASPLLGKLLGEPIGPVERVQFDVMRLARIAEILARRTQRGLRQLEQGRLELPVKDSATARATRKLSPGIRSLNSAILCMTFSVLSGLSFRDHNLLLAIPILTGGLFFMGRWLVLEKRMESWEESGMKERDIPATVLRTVSADSSASGSGMRADVFGPLLEYPQPSFIHCLLLSAAFFLLSHHSAILLLWCCIILSSFRHFSALTFHRKSSIDAFTISLNPLARVRLYPHPRCEAPRERYGGVHRSAFGACSSTSRGGV